MVYFCNVHICKLCKKRGAELVLTTVATTHTKKLAKVYM